MVMLAMRVLVAILVLFWMLYWATGHPYTPYPKVQPVALYCSSATLSIQDQADGNSGSCMARFMCPNRA